MPLSSFLSFVIKNWEPRYSCALRLVCSFKYFQSFNIWVSALAVSDIVLAIVVIILNPQVTLIYQFDIQQKYFWLTFFITTSSYLLVGMNLDRAIAIKNILYSSQQSNKTITLKLLVCCLLAFAPGAPYLFNETLTKCKIKNPEDYCWPPSDSVMIISDLLTNMLIVVFSELPDFLEPSHRVSNSHWYNIDSLVCYIHGASEGVNTKFILLQL